MTDRKEQMMAKKVVDVSGYQEIIDWKKVKESGINGAILKIIRKDLNPDKQFENNWRGCSAAGMPVVGVYNYSYATTVAKARGDAQKVISILAGRKTKVWLDVEDKVQKRLGRLLIDIIKAYQAVIEGAGLEFGVYTGISFYNSYIKQYSSLINCNFWMARYPSSKKMNISSMPAEGKKPAIRHIMEGWQFTSKAIVPGIYVKKDRKVIPADVDLSLWYGIVGGAQVVHNTASSTVYGGLDYAPGFDAGYYSDRYRDLKAAYGSNGAALFTHFIAHGMREGRQAIDTFNVQAYKSRYTDLQKTFGDNLPLYYQHYVQFGMKERRNAL